MQTNYADIARSLPAPTAEQCAAFVRWFPQREQRYRARGTLLAGIKVLIYLDPQAGTGFPQEKSGYVRGPVVNEQDWLRAFGHLNILEQWADERELSLDGDAREPAWTPRNGAIFPKWSDWQRYRPEEYTRDGTLRTISIPDLPPGFYERCVAHVYPYINPMHLDYEYEVFKGQMAAIAAGHPHPDSERLLELRTLEQEFDCARSDGLTDKHLRLVRSLGDIARRHRYSVLRGVTYADARRELRSSEDRPIYSDLPRNVRTLALLELRIQTLLFELMVSEMQKLERAVHNLISFIKSVRGSDA